MSVPLNLRPVRDIFDQASSTAPTPGGGSVAALCGMLGISLVLKALRISLRKNPDAASYDALDAQLGALGDALSEDADADARAFEAYIAAARLPKESEAQQRTRGAALRMAAVEATEAALRMLGNAKDAFALTRTIEAVVKESIRADLIAGRELLKVVRSVAVENATANLGGLRDEAERKRLQDRLDQDSRAEDFA
jgi:formiminotetrahydrofolate cyclodeaminase